MDKMSQIRELALKNAIQHQGKADPKAVLASLLSQNPDLRKKAKELMQEAAREVEKVNSLAGEEQKKEFDALGGKIEKKKEEEKKLPPLPNAGSYKEIVLRFEPSPSGPLHFGHARAIILNDEYAKLYKGKLILRIADTNAKNIDLSAYEKIPRDLDWLGCAISEAYLQSDRVKLYQGYMLKLIEAGHAYACNCPQEEFKKLIDARQPCKCRGLSQNEHLLRWKLMLKGEKGFVARIKTDLAHKNPAIRDWPAFRIVEEKHPRSSETLWPLMNFAVAIDDHLMGLTHVLRGKDHLDNTERQKYIFKYFGWKLPEYLHYGRMNLDAEIPLSKTKIKKAIAEGELSGWEDARLPTLEVLRKRGIQPKAIRQAMLDVGIKQVDFTFSWENLYSINKKGIDPVAERYFFVENPVKLKIEGAPAKDVKLAKHPARPEAGYRAYKVEKSPEIWVSEKDLNHEAPIRLKDLYNVLAHRKELRTGYSGDAEGLPAEYAGDAVIDPKVQWVQGGVPCQVHMPDGKILSGLAENECAKLKPGAVIQFERFGFACIAEAGARIKAYYAHK